MRDVLQRIARIHDGRGMLGDERIGEGAVIRDDRYDVVLLKRFFADLDRLKAEVACVAGNIERRDVGIRVIDLGDTSVMQQLDHAAGR